jgi:glutaredoxin 3
MVYKKSGCPWAAEVTRFLSEQGLLYEVKNMTEHPEYKNEIEARSGQSKSPTLDIDGTILPDAGVEDVAEFLKKRGAFIEG